MYTIYTYLWLIWVGCITYLSYVFLIFLVTLLFSLWNIAPSLLTFKYLPTICLSTYMVLSWLFSNICSNIGLSFWKCYEPLKNITDYRALLFEEKKCFFGSCKRCVDACKQASLWLLARNLMEHYYIGICMPRLLYNVHKYECKTETCRYKEKCNNL